MLYNLLYPLTEYVSVFNLFQYITVRAGGALFTAFLLTLLCGQQIIAFLKVWQSGGATVKDVLPHASKVGTPTMGGLMVVGSFTLGSLLWADLTNSYVWVVLVTTFIFGAIGFCDDWLALRKRWRHGLPGRLRLIVQFSLAALFLVIIMLVSKVSVPTDIHLPFFKDVVLPLGLAGFMLFGMFVMVGSVNAVNLTDGLDGLVSIPAAIVAGSLGVLAYITGRVDYTDYLNLTHIAGAGELSVLCSSMVGATLGFLWFNAPPARIFMGDTGALAIGAFLASVALIIKQEITLAIIGGLFVLETVSVMLQVFSFKVFKRRVFKMAPLHHHFEQLGWPESTIVVRFWIISLMFALIGLGTLKLR